MNPEQIVAKRLEIESLEALVASIKAGPEAGLALLGSKNDPEAVRRRLLILIQARREREAAASIQAQKPHPLWSDLAITALGKCGMIEEASRIFAQSRQFE